MSYLIKTTIFILFIIQTQSTKKNAGMDGLLDDYSMNNLFNPDNHIMENEKFGSSLKPENLNTQECTLKLTITLLEFKLYESKTSSNIKLLTTLELKEKLLNSSNSIIKNNKDIKIIKKEIQNPEKKKLSEFSNGNYMLRTKLEGIYWTYLKKKTFIKKGNLPKFENNANSESIEEDDFSNKNFSLKDSKENNSLEIRLPEVPCDVKLGNLGIVGRLSEEKREITKKIFGCFNNTKLENFVNAFFDFDFNFLSKEHLRYDGTKMEKILEKKNRRFSKFRSFLRLKNNLDDNDSN